MERKIGELFELAGEMIECVEREDRGCRPCFFNKGTCCHNTDEGFCDKAFRTDEENVMFKKIKDMENQKEVKISIPEGYELDKEKSSFERIVFKKEQKIKKWDDLMGTIIPEKSFYVTDYSDIKGMSVDKCKFVEAHKNVSIDERHAKSVLAFAQISQLIPYFGGEITEEEWNNINIPKYRLGKVKNEIIEDITFAHYSLLSFHTIEQRDEFLKYNEQLVKDYLMIE